MSTGSGSMGEISSCCTLWLYLRTLRVRCSNALFNFSSILWKCFISIGCQNSNPTKMFPGPPAAQRVFPGPASNRDYAGCQFALYGPPAGRKPVGMCNPSRNNAYRAKLQRPIALSVPLFHEFEFRKKLSPIWSMKSSFCPKKYVCLWWNSGERKDITGVNMIDL